MSVEQESKTWLEEQEQMRTFGRRAPYNPYMGIVSPTPFGVLQEIGKVLTYCPENKERELLLEALWKMYAETKMPFQQIQGSNDGTGISTTPT